jgi:hypothetical protein
MDTKVVAEVVSAAALSVAAGTGVWALIYASKQLKHAREAERVKHLVEFNREFDSESMTKWRKIVAEQRLKGVAYPDESQRLLDFFETIGLLVRRGYLDEYDVWSTFSYWMFNIYADFREDIEQLQRDDKNYYLDSCELQKRLREIEHEMGSRDDRPSREEIRDFWEDEMKVVPGSPLKKRKRAKGKSTAKSVAEPSKAV